MAIESQALGRLFLFFFVEVSTELEFLNNLWGLGNE
jgi:hypothetical protein